jgi:predicted GTPase
MIEWVVLGGAAWLLSQVLKNGPPHPRGAAELTTPSPHYEAPERIVALVGRANSGKSSTGNALLRREEFPVGPVHGTTWQSRLAPFKAGYKLLDTPGLFDSAIATAPVDLQRAEIVVFVCTGQLLRPEVDEVRRIVGLQDRCNRFSSGRRRRLLIYANQQDVAAIKSGPADLETQKAALQEQVKAVAPASAIVFGTAGSPPNGVEPDITSLASMLDCWMDLN